MLTALVVEDEPLVRLVTVQLLEDAGYVALEARDAAEAIAIMEARPDVRIVLTDINMPGDMDGIRLAHYVRNRWPPVHLLVLSGRPLTGDLPNRAQFLEKPVLAGQLVATLERFSSVAPS